MALQHSPAKSKSSHQNNEPIPVEESNGARSDGQIDGFQRSQDTQSSRERIPSLAGYVSDDIISAIRKPQPPPFMKDRPDIWFFLIESEFNATRTRSDEAKFNATLRALDTDTLQQITDILYNPPEQNKYENLKHAILQRLSDSRQKQIQRLLNDLILADKKTLTTSP